MQLSYNFSNMYTKLIDNNYKKKTGQLTNEAMSLSP